MRASPPPRVRRSALCRRLACVALSTLVLAPSAQAQSRRGRLSPVAEARWRALLQQAFVQSNQGEHAVALQLAEEAAATQMTPGVRLFLAEEHEFLSRAASGGGHLVEAERQSLGCLEDATAQRGLDDRPRILRDCALVRDRVRARMVRLTVEVPNPPTGAVVRVNGEALAATAYGLQTRRLAGVYVIEATAPRHGSFRHTVTLPEGAAARVTAVIPAPSPLPGG